MYLICINLPLERYAPLGLVNADQKYITPPRALTITYITYFVYFILNYH